MIVYLFLFVQLLLGLMFVFLTLALFTGAPFVPTKKKTAEKMIELAQIENNDIVYDLGSGDGRLLFLARKRTHNTIVGIEINPLLVFLTWIKQLVLGARIKPVWGNFWNTPISDADVVFVYLLPWKMDRLADKLEKELKPGTTIVSNSFIFPHWKIIDQDTTLNVFVFKKQ